jgi:adenosine deaminase
VVDDLAKHPLRRMLDKGPVVTVNSDDPAHFGGYLNQNFRAISAALGLGRDEIAHDRAQRYPGGADDGGGEGQGAGGG